MIGDHLAARPECVALVDEPLCFSFALPLNLIECALEQMKVIHGLTKGGVRIDAADEVNKLHINKYPEGCISQKSNAHNAPKSAESGWAQRWSDWKPSDHPAGLRADRAMLGAGAAAAVD